MDNVQSISNIGNEAIQNVASLYNTDNMTITNLTTMNTLKVKDLLVTGDFNLLPKGVILAYNGTSPPQGWALCDGQNGAPDLRSRFIIGAGSSAPFSNKVLGEIGGEENHTLTIDELPSHSFQVLGLGQACSFNNCGSGRNTVMVDATNQLIRSTNTIGGSKPHNNMPPYYVLTYIIKL